MTVTASHAAPAGVTPLSFVLGILAFVVLVAVIGGVARFVRTGHRAGVARLAAYDARTTAGARRAAQATRRHRNGRTVIDVDDAGTVRGITVTRRAR